MLSNYSWQAFKIARDKLYGDWVDRGCNHPTHGEWSDYLRWVFNSTGYDILQGELKTIIPNEEYWVATYTSTEKNETVEEIFDAIVLTGPGPIKPLSNMPLIGNLIFDGVNFWQNLNIFEKSIEDDDPIIVIGSGETAASVTTQLIKLRKGKKIPLLIVNRHGTIFSRGEGYFENRIFTDPGLWDNLSLDERRGIIVRADRGVISVDAHRAIATANDIRHVTADIIGVAIENDFANASRVERVYINGSKGESIPGQYAIVATGFDAWWWTECLPDYIRGIFADKNIRPIIEDAITEDLAIADYFLKPKLHVPMLSGIAQGPGFPNLSCLGHLSDNILRAYVKKIKEGP